MPGSFIYPVITVGMKCGNWKVLEDLGVVSHKHLWKVACAICGALDEVVQGELKRVKKGGCISCRKIKNPVFVGDIFGKWLVLYKGKTGYWMCKCSGCSKEIEVAHSTLVSGSSRGCIQCSYKDNKQHTMFAVGDIVGSLTLLEETRVYVKRGTVAAFNTRCSCGGVRTVRIEYLRKTNVHHSCINCARYRKYPNVGAVPGWYMCRVENGAESRGIKVEVKQHYLSSLWEEQKGICSLTGLSLVLDTVKNTTASLDRIDSLQGYVEGNVQWIHKDVNIMKSKFDQDYFIEMCELIARRSRGTK